MTCISLLDRLGHRALGNKTPPRSVGIRMAPLSNEKSAQVEADGIWEEGKRKMAQCVASPRSFLQTELESRPHAGGHHNAWPWQCEEVSE